MTLRRLLWRVDSRRQRVVWTWDDAGVECYVVGNEHVRGRGRTGVEALRALMGGR